MSKSDLVLTPGPWGWRQPAGSREMNLCTVGRGMLYVLSPARAGMNGATIRFGHRTAAERGGLLKEVPVREHGSPDYLRDGELTPDARLIQAAPELCQLLRRVMVARGRDGLPPILVDEIAVALGHIDGVWPSHSPSNTHTDVSGGSVEDAVRQYTRERALLDSLGLTPPTSGASA